MKKILIVLAIALGSLSNSPKATADECHFAVWYVYDGWAGPDWYAGRMCTNNWMQQTYFTPMLPFG